MLVAIALAVVDLASMVLGCRSACSCRAGCCCCGIDGTPLRKCWLLLIWLRWYSVAEVLAVVDLLSMVLRCGSACSYRAGCCCYGFCCSSFNGTPLRKSLSLSHWLRWYSVAKVLVVIALAVVVVAAVVQASMVLHARSPCRYRACCFCAGFDGTPPRRSC